MKRNAIFNRHWIWTIVFSILLLHGQGFAQARVQADMHWISYKGEKGPGKGRHIVLISGDEEYRSEEALPALGRLLSEQHGFDCTVLFAINRETGRIDPTVTDNIPGLHLLKKADIMILFTRFRNLPAEQMRYFEDYLKEGKPILALRTATHAFNFPKESPYFKYSYNSDVMGWEGGFGKQILGETWISHHGDHGSEGTMTIKTTSEHSILTGVKPIWVPTDVYTAAPSADAIVLLLGQPTRGMDANSPLNRNKSPMPVAWTKLYRVKEGKQGKVFTTTMGSSVDMLDENFRRLLINATFWATGMETKIRSDLSVEVSENYAPTMFGFDTFTRNTTPEDRK